LIVEETAMSMEAHFVEAVVRQLYGMPIPELLFRLRVHRDVGAVQSGLHPRSFNQQSVLNRSLNMFTLIGLGVAVAYAYSVIARELKGLVPSSSAWSVQSDGAGAT
jgi:hypothetical protein